MTNSFDRIAAQGDVLFTKIDELPDDVVEVAPEDGTHVITHSETGHHHIMRADRVKRFLPNEGQFGDGGMVSYLQVDEPTEIKHLRPHDTHAPITFRPGVYEVRRQREYTPEGWRRVED